CSARRNADAGVSLRDDPAPRVSGGDQQHLHLAVGRPVRDDTGLTKQFCQTLTITKFFRFFRISGPTLAAIWLASACPLRLNNPRCCRAESSHLHTCSRRRRSSLSDHTASEGLEFIERA